MVVCRDIWKILNGKEAFILKDKNSIKNNIKFLVIS